MVQHCKLVQIILSTHVRINQNDFGTIIYRWVAKLMTNTFATAILACVSDASKW
jgi:phage baseplate assembly protein W